MPGPNEAPHAGSVVPHMVSPVSPPRTVLLFTSCDSVTKLVTDKLPRLSFLFGVFNCLLIFSKVWLKG